MAEEVLDQQEEELHTQYIGSRKYVVAGGRWPISQCVLT
jgi:hypothetical protein